MYLMTAHCTYNNYLECIYKGQALLFSTLGYDLPAIFANEFAVHVPFGQIWSPEFILCPEKFHSTSQLLTLPGIPAMSPALLPYVLQFLCLCKGRLIRV